MRSHIKYMSRSTTNTTTAPATHLPSCCRMPCPASCGVASLLAGVVSTTRALPASPLPAVRTDAPGPSAPTPTPRGVLRETTTTTEPSGTRGASEVGSGWYIIRDAPPAKHGARAPSSLIVRTGRNRGVAACGVKQSSAACSLRTEDQLQERPDTIQHKHNREQGRKAHSHDPQPKTRSSNTIHERAFVWIGRRKWVVYKRPHRSR